jgi:hypothetical protein
MNILEKIFKNTDRIQRTAEYLPMGVIISSQDASEYNPGDQVIFDEDKVCLLDTGVILAHDSHLTKLI